MSCAPQQKKLVYPETAKVDTVDVYFGTQVPDPYRWLENDTSAATTAWVEAQNKVTNEYLSQIPFRENLLKRLTTLVVITRRSVRQSRNMANITSVKMTVCKTRVYSTYRIHWTANLAFSSTRTSSRTMAQ
ncbi:hypothetical protein NXW38_13835 [Bacteroides ovatus]|nr:hypothetical protein [Bacteroides ovatus]